MTDDQFSKAFKKIVPDAPSPDDWAAGALRKRRNRAGIVGGTVGVLAVALAIPVTLNLANSPLSADPAEQAAAENPEQAPADSDGAPPAPVQGDGLLGAAACFDDAGQLVQPGADDVPLEPGAVRAWLCGDATADNPFGTVGPLEPLEQDVDHIVEFVEAQEEVNLAAMTCTMEYSLAYLVVLEYSDGSRAMVRGETHGCQTIMEGETARAGGVEFLDHLTGLWSAQRDAIGAPEGSPGTPACPAPATMLLPGLDEIVAGAVCVGDANTGEYERAELQPDEVERVVADIQANAVEGEVMGWDTGLVLVGPWGDWLRLFASEDGSSHGFFDADGTSWTWTPTPEVAELLASVVGSSEMPAQPPTKEPGTPVDPDPTSVIFEPDACQGVQSGDLVTGQLPDGALPDAPDAVWLCGKGLGGGTVPAGPLEPLTGAAAQTAVDLFNALPELDPNQACTADLGPSYFVVHEYADGTRLPVEMQDYGCHGVWAGEDVRADGAAYVESLVGLWTELREAAGVPAERPGPVCVATPSIIPVNLADGFTAGVACTGLNGEGDAAETPLAPDLLEAVATLVVESANPMPSEAVGSAATNSALVLLNQYGDPLRLDLHEDGTFQWWDGEQTVLWEPPSAVAVELDGLLGG